MTALITLLCILIPVFVYFAITFYANNKLYIDILAAVVWDRVCDKIDDYWRVCVWRVNKWEYNRGEWVRTKYKVGMRRFKK